MEAVEVKIPSQYTYQYWIIQDKLFGSTVCILNFIKSGGTTESEFSELSLNNRCTPFLI